MSGSNEEKGIISLSAEEIFKRVNSEEDEEEPEARKIGSIVPPEMIKKSVKVVASYVEIYNESVNDLLDTSKKNLEIREDKINNQIFIDGLTKIEVQNKQQIIDLLRKGSEMKKIASTKMNEKSSRSHTVFRIEL